MPSPAFPVADPLSVTLEHGAFHADWHKPDSGSADRPIAPHNRAAPPDDYKPDNGTKAVDRRGGKDRVYLSEQIARFGFHGFAWPSWLAGLCPSPKRLGNLVTEACITEREIAVCRLADLIHQPRLQFGAE